ncbi:LAMI_0C03092g1_1 [Lachancea mirantina]|uniref:LAMI_0C03092g1_1 n=1 Tax=Lachancea mirantina TaxID=1230905 RepID=A0A1G4J1C2_9SACH|nr:LAMI_0C03092g1_1 [Lachancea mirantina]
MTETPKKERSKRVSIELTGELLDAGPKSPQTPSPPSNRGRRSSTSLGFLASPLGKDNRNVGIGGGGNDRITLPKSPSARSRLLPPVTPKSRSSEVFLSPSPKLKSPGVTKDSEKPIREISNNLKTRLNYAFVKLQHGWTDKSLVELESEFEKTAGQQPQEGKRLSQPSSLDAATAGGPSKEELLSGSSNYSNAFMKQDEDDSNSAHVALLNALSSPKRKRPPSPGSSTFWANRSRHLAPISTSAPAKDNSKNGGQPSEAEAIETLMSLASPKKKSHQEISTDFSLPAPPTLSKDLDQPKMAYSSRSSSASSLQNTLSKPFLLSNESGQKASALLDVETDVEEQNDDENEI